jgi:hypothetical protein
VAERPVSGTHSSISMTIYVAGLGDLLARARQQEPKAVLRSPTWSRGRSQIPIGASARHFDLGRGGGDKPAARRKERDNTLCLLAMLKHGTTALDREQVQTLLAADQSAGPKASSRIA